MTKVDYGYDAPPIIITMAATGFVILLIGFLPFIYPAYFYAWLSYGILGITATMSLSFLVTATLMICSSRYGKLRVIKEMVHTLSLKGHEQILDVGCGRGLLAITSAKYLTNGKVVGIDIWRQQDQSGNSQAQTIHNAHIENVADRVEIKTNDMTAMQFANNSFDVVVSCLAIHNVYDDAQRKQAIHEIARVTKPGGRLALLDFKNTEEYAQWLRELGWPHVRVSKIEKRMFPPVRIVHAIKPD